MKFLVVLAVLVALCAGGAVPLVPGDNSQYGDGSLRMIELDGPMDEETLQNLRNGDIAAFTLTGDNNVAYMELYVHSSRAQELLKHLERSKNNNDF